MTPRHALLACVLAALPATSGTAAAAPYTFFGSGTFSPGIPTVGCVGALDVQFTGTGVTYPPPAVGPSSFEGNSTVCASLLSDVGTGTFTGAIHGSVRYTRTGTHMTFTGSGISLACDLTPTSWNPWTSYLIACGSGLSGST